MANAAGFIQESIWRNDHWRKLSRSSQALYLQLLSQKELDCAGILPLQPNKWAKGCDEITVDDVWRDLNELQEQRYVFIDTETDEAFIRTYMRNSNVIKVPNMRRAASRAAKLVGSEFIRPLLAAELRATGDPECVEAADLINPSGTPPEPFPNGSKLTLPEPLPEPTGVGKGKGVTHQRSNQVGEEPPSQFCKNHPTGTDRPCRPCGQARQAFEAWEQDQESAARENELIERRRIREARDACPVCDENGLRPARLGLARCNHEEAANA